MTEASSSDTAALASEVKSLTAAVARLERVIEKEINQLKAEQIADLKTSISRIADDQRRLWEAVRALELRSSGQGGAFRVIHGVAVFLGSLLTAVVMVTLGKLWR